jgi:hypothetical protein
MHHLPSITLHPSMVQDEKIHTCIYSIHCKSILSFHSTTRCLTNLPLLLLILITDKIEADFNITLRTLYTSEFQLCTIYFFLDTPYFRRKFTFLLIHAASAHFAIHREITPYGTKLNIQY